MSGPDEEAPAVEVAYALPDRQDVVRVQLAEGMTALDAVDASGLRQAHAELEGRSPDLGIFGRPVPPDQVLSDGDRVEIYRVLRVDPREARRTLASRGETMGPAARRNR